MHESRSVRKPVLTLVTFGALLLTQTASAAEGEWTRFRGPNGSGISQATTVPVRWTEKDYNWRVKLPGIGHSSPVVWERRIYATGGDPETGKLTVCCLDAGDGHTVWQREYPSKTYPQHPDSTYATATPTVDEDGVVLTWSAPEAVTLLALDHNGGEVWRRNLGAFVTVQGSGISPILFQGLVILNNDQEDPNLLPGPKRNPPAAPGRSFLIAVDRKTGQTRWQVERRTSYSAYSTPCIQRTPDNRPVLMCSNTSHGISALDPSTGKVLWEFGQPFLDRAISSPVVAPGLVIAGHGAGLRGLRYIAVRTGTREPESQPTLAYELKKAIPLVPTPLIKDDRLFLWTDDGFASCLKLETGEVLWHERVGGSYYASPVWVNGRLYNVAKNGDVVVIAAEDKFQLLAQMSLGESSYATPAVAGGVMYLRTRTQLFALGGPDKKN